MVGIAFGVDPKNQPVGTILVSKQIQTYELQRVNKDASIALRGDKVPASPMLLNWAAHAEVEWPEDGPGIKKGLVLSGEKLVDNQDFRDQLVLLAPEALGGEMEGAGLYVASQTAKVEWLLVKAVCDWADGNKAKNKEKLQAKAAATAAKFSVLMLRTTSENRS
jgi:nucleoside phosphorylase